jgi:hypothetical protein
MIVEVTVPFIWTVVVTLIGAAVGYGKLLMMANTTNKRITNFEKEVREDLLPHLEEKVTFNAAAAVLHREETIDRLARLETKIDVLLKR